MYESNPQNADFNEFNFYCSQWLIIVQRIYHVNDDIKERLKFWFDN